MKNVRLIHTHTHTHRQGLDLCVAVFLVNLMMKVWRTTWCTTGLQLHNCWEIYETARRPFVLHPRTHCYTPYTHRPRLLFTHHHTRRTALVLHRVQSCNFPFCLWRSWTCSRSHHVTPQITARTRRSSHSQLLTHARARVNTDHRRHAAQFQRIKVNQRV